MNLRKILKNRKAMTPIMIGIIVAASVLAVFFLIMAITIPYMRSDVQMSIVPNSIKGNTTDDESLIFKVMCDYDNGTITKFEIYYEAQLYGNNSVDIDMGFRDVRFIQVRYFDANLGIVPPAQVQNSTHLVFQEGQTYTLRLYYENLDGLERPFIESEFVYDLPS